MRSGRREKQYMSKHSVSDIIIDYIEAHLDEDLSLDKIAKDLNYSKFYIARTFVEKTGKSVYKYIQGRRLTLAAQKLVETKEPIVEIAYEAHYNSQQAFTFAFSQLYLCTPQVYRKNGIFYPKQLRLSTQNTKACMASISWWKGEKMAA